MKGILCILAVVTLWLAVVEPLVCNKCSVVLLGKCISGSTITCSNTSMCYTTTATFPFLGNPAGVARDGCTNNSDCNVTTTGTIFGVNYTVTQSCCSTDLCNAALPSSPLSLSLCASAALLALLPSGWPY